MCLCPLFLMPHSPPIAASVTHSTTLEKFSEYFTTCCVAGFHTFDYARHFLSCASRMLGLEHETLRGAISIEYYGRNVGIKIMPTGETQLRLEGAT
jgi:trehalose 6-phosphate synthase/phosphatase